MTYYIFIENETIDGKGQCKRLDEGVQNIEVEEEIYNDIEKYIYQDGEIVLNPNYEAEQEQKEKERIQELKMSKSDFFDGTIDAWGVNEDALLPLIQSMLAPLPLDEKQKLKAINNFKNAQNFYRKHDLFKMIVNIPLQLTESIQVIITDEHLDKFFDEVDKGNKDTAWQYLPQPVQIPVEVENEIATNTTKPTDVPVQPQDEDGLQEGEIED